MRVVDAVYRWHATQFKLFIYYLYVLWKCAHFMYIYMLHKLTHSFPYRALELKIKTATKCIQIMFVFLFVFVLVREYIFGGS